VEPRVLQVQAGLVVKTEFQQVRYTILTKVKVQELLDIRCFPLILQELLSRQ
jgi:hypothetical protein